MRAHLVQLDIAWENPTENHERVMQLLDRVETAPGDLVVLPEMFATGFSGNRAAVNDKRGETLGFLCELAKERKVSVQAGRAHAACSVNDACKIKNVMSVVTPGGRLLTEYSKRRLFPSEAERVEAGSVCVVWPWDSWGDSWGNSGTPAPGIAATQSLNVCPLICYDLRFPELFADGLRHGAEVFAVGACWPKMRAAHWRALLIARAIECQAYVLGVNRTGVDPGPPQADSWVYHGGSIAVSPTGEVLGELGEAPGVLSVAMPREPLDAWRRAFPAWKSRG